MKRLETRWVRESNPPSYNGKSVGCAVDVVEISKAMLGEHVREVLVVWFLNNRHSVLGYQKIHEGSMSAVHIDVGDVMAAVLQSGASSFIVVHNHPSGVATPSADDFKITKRLVNAAALLCRNLLDHVVVTDADHYSMQQNGTMPLATPNLL